MMATALLPVPPFRPAGPIDYPEDNGEPLSDNTFQFEWIMTIQGGLDSLFADRPDVFVAGNLLWYPIEGDNQTSVAPDAMVVFGRPKGPRTSYRQWEEGGVCPQVTFEVGSPSNTVAEMTRKRQLYARLGVQEYYFYDPGDPRDGENRITDLQGWQRSGAGSGLTPIPEMNGWRSPRLDITFEFGQNGEFRIIRPDGRPFETFVETSQRMDALQKSLDQTRQRAEQERQRADAAQQRADLLAERLRAAGLDADA